MRKILILDAVLVALAFVIVVACSSPASPSSDSAGSNTTGTAGASTSTAPMLARFSSAVTVSSDGSTVTLRSQSIPDHTSPYWGVGNTKYEVPQAGMQVNPNLIVAQTLTLRVPASPAIASAGSDTPLGPIGMAVNGVPLFNQYAAGRSPRGPEILSFDRLNGHPQQQGQYHYHLEPIWLTGINGPSALVGVLLDGFPVYGTREADGSTASALDSCNGHVGATPDFSGGIYHYHVIAVSPYISGCFKGSAGSVG